ncbi:MAG: hypothetical protein WED15_07125 [Akkermansiaceae bacterium]
MTTSRTALFFLLSLTLLPLTAAPVVTITTDRPGAIYAENEEVAFTIKAWDGNAVFDASTVAWTLSLDGDKTLASGTGTTANGSLDRPGFILLNATYTGADGKTISAYGAAGISATAITPSLPAPDDFDALWGEPGDT